MPRLPAEPFIFPNDLLSKEMGSGEQDERWWVMHTRPRQEKCLARELLNSNVCFYLPILARRVRFNGGIGNSYQPLFPGYVAVFGNDRDRITTLETKRVVNVLSVTDQEEFHADLHRLFRLIESGMPITREDRLTNGDRVIIRSGPLAGLEGVVLRAETGQRFLVQVNFIQRGASVLADNFDLQCV